MKWIASGIGRCHAPELTRPALISAFVAGADGFRLPLRLSADNRAIVFEDETAERLTGTAGVVSKLTLKELRALDSGAKFTEADGSVFAYRARVESFGMLLDALPGSANLLLELKPEPDATRRTELANQAAAGIAHRQRNALTTVFGQQADALVAFRKKCPGATIALHSPGKPGNQALADAISAGVDGIVLSAGQLVTAGGGSSPLAAQLQTAQQQGKLSFGALIIAGSLTAADHKALTGMKGIWGIVIDSFLEAASVVRPGWIWVDEKWTQQAAKGEDVNQDLWRLGYAKYNPERYCHVFADNGIHIDIKPFSGAITSTSHGDPLEDKLQQLLSRSWDALKDWPFYSGGGAGFAPGINGDFSAEVDIKSDAAQQATTVEMAAMNVDPGPHRAPWVQNSNGQFVPNYPASFRDKHTSFDPHGAPPYAGVEHDEDDGWRINWNLGTDYDSNQYGHAVGDGKLLTGRMRLDRRGAYFAAYYRATGKSQPEDWICVGVARNATLNPIVYLRLAGKRWRQEDPNNPSQFMPVIPNHFVFQNFTLTRFL